jgi:hypothetical protein
MTTMPDTQDQQNPAPPKPPKLPPPKVPHVYVQTGLGRGKVEKP